jgi:glutamate/tyrosine decarboxylase-like PLP-dependent enzyme
VIEDLARAAEPALVTSAGPRYFGFVIGGALNATTCADMLTAGWDQNAFNATTSPASAIAEETVGGWLKDLLGIPTPASFVLVTGAQAPNTVGLAAGRQRVLQQAGSDVEELGLQGAPLVRVLAR